MNDDLHRHLDGELSMDTLEGEARKEAEAWERLLEGFRGDTPLAPAPPWLESRVMAEIEALPEPGLIRRFGSWLTSPRPVRVSPLSVGLVAAAVATVLLVGLPSPEGPMGISESGSGNPATAASAVQAAESAAVIYVQFALDAPGASSVAVAGDFDDWAGSSVLEDVNGDGIWTGRIPVRPGVHAYMFLVDGSTWVTDPRADRYADDGFGNRNAILAVAGPAV